MKFCSKCGKEILDEAVVCPHCGCSVTPVEQPQEDVVSVGFCVLSAFIPLFGLIYWAVMHSKTPKRAKACGITALVVWGVGIVLSWIFSFSILGAVFSALSAI